MADYSVDVNCKYDTNTYEGTIKAYRWIEKSMQKTDYNNLNFRSEFVFNTGSIRCKCDSIEEFIENAYQQPNYKFCSMLISIYHRKSIKSIAHIIKMYDEKLTINADNKHTIQCISEALDNTSLGEDEQQQVQAIYIETQNNIGEINGDNNNVIAGNRNTINNGEKEKGSWKKAIAQNLAANGIWYLLVAGLSALAGVLLS